MAGFVGADWPSETRYMEYQDGSFMTDGNFVDKTDTTFSSLYGGGEKRDCFQLGSNSCHFFTPSLPCLSKNKRWMFLEKASDEFNVILISEIPPLTFSFVEFWSCNAIKKICACKS